MQTTLFFEFAKRNVRLHWLRSLLAIIGIIIGVTAIVSMGILGNSLVLAISDSLSTVGDSVIVTPHVGGGSFSMGSASERITERQLEQIKRAVAPDITIPVYSGSARMKVGTKDTAGVVYGLRPDDIPVLLEVEQGSYLRGSSGAMAGARFAKENDLRVGSRITIKDKGTLRVVGILKERGMGFDINPDYGIVVEDKWYEQAYGQKDYDMVIVKVRDISRIEETKKVIEKQLNRRETVVDVIDTKAILETILDTFGRISTFTTAIGGISLIVAGVSILNIMMMSVTERIREIGVLRSIGTLRKEVMSMFLFEALILGIIGSLIGGVLSIIGGYAVSLLMLRTSEYLFVPSSMVYVLYGVAFGIGTSLLSGLYPAWKASNLNPIEALRHE
ncbi:MAG TPA: ABC transporter permease [Methanolinea sp.]|jgi:putative ABC transport system permease protein|nr:ABC transporter permease [Methanolinea sp.]HOS82354.1 ABC transporter permease [Methanolinea sp.]HPC55660.1 ABC transporter permease [Methanolinea sp.]HQE86024.1 ABC transporter permease [Methanolinea sp.]HQI14906.1 ABC transporter permease [Methanolinea sp.]